MIKYIGLLVCIAGVISQYMSGNTSAMMRAITATMRCGIAIVSDI